MAMSIKGYYPLLAISFVALVWIEYINAMVVGFLQPYLGFLGTYASYGALFISLFILFYVVSRFMSKQTGLKK